LKLLGIMVERPRKRATLTRVEPTFKITYNPVVQTVDTINPDVQTQMLHWCDALFDPAASTASRQNSAQQFHDCVQNHSDDARAQALYRIITQIIIKKHDVVENDKGIGIGHDQKVSFKISDQKVIAGSVERDAKLPTDKAVFATVGQEHVDFPETLESMKVPVAFSFNLWRDANDAPLGTYYRDMKTFTSPYPIENVLKDGIDTGIFKPNYTFKPGPPEAQQSNKGEIIPVVAMPHWAPSAQDLVTAMQEYNVNARYNVIVMVKYPEAVFTVTEQGDKSNSQTNLRF